MQGDSDILSLFDTNAPQRVPGRGPQRLPAGHQEGAGHVDRVQQRTLPRPLRALQGGQVHPDQAPLVVEGEQGVQPARGHQEPQRAGGVPGGRPLRGRRLHLRAETDGQDLQGVVQALQCFVSGDLSEDLQLLRRRQKGKSGFAVVVLFTQVWQSNS